LPLKSLLKKKRNKDEDTCVDLPETDLRRGEIEGLRARQRGESRTFVRPFENRNEGRSEQRIKNLRTRTPTAIKCNTKLRGAKDHFSKLLPRIIIFSLIIFPLYYC
jgi:hypothetical protein